MQFCTVNSVLLYDNENFTVTQLSVLKIGYKFVHSCVIYWWVWFMCIHLARSNGKKLNIYLPQCSFKLSYFLIQWMSGNSKVCHQIVENGWIAHHLFILHCLRDAGLVSAYSICTVLVHTCICVSVCVCLYLCVCVCVSVYMWVISVWMCGWVVECACVQTCVRTHVFVYVQVV